MRIGCCIHEERCLGQAQQGAQIISVSTSEQLLLRQWRSLKPDQQNAALEFVEFLHRKSTGKKQRRSLLGLCANTNIYVSAQDITEARREMWGDFPRDI